MTAKFDFRLAVGVSLGKRINGTPLSPFICNFWRGKVSREILWKQQSGILYKIASPVRKYWETSISAATIPTAFNESFLNLRETGNEVNVEYKQAIINAISLFKKKKKEYFEQFS